MYFDDVYNQFLKGEKIYIFYYFNIIDDWMYEVEKDYEIILKKIKKMMR